MFSRLRNYIAGRLASAKQARPVGTNRYADQGPVAIGRLHVETREVSPETGKPTEEWQTHSDDTNLVLMQAERLMAQAIIAAADSALNYIELGDPTAPATPPALADLGLQQSTGQRKAFSSLVANVNVVTATSIWSTAEGNGFTYTEAGLFTGVLGAGLIFARKTFAGITKSNSFEMRMTWYITFLVQTSGSDCAGVSLIGPGTVANDTIYVAAGGEASVSATFDFVVGANNVDVFLNGQRLVRGRQYLEAVSPLNAPIGGPPTNKGINLIGFTLDAGWVVYLVQRTLA
jgi:hypothetical protein